MDSGVAAENGLKYPQGSATKADGDETEDEEDDDRHEHTNVTTSVADLCSASHEFEWLSPESQRMYHEKHGDDEPENSAEQQPAASEDQQGLASCEVSPARSVHKHHKPHAWPRRSDIIDHLRVSPNPYSELHGCRRHLSPMRSSWCCPSPPPVCVYHGGAILSGMELVPYNCDYYSNDCVPYQNCSCLPPTGLPHSPRHHDSLTWCKNGSPHHEIMRREASSPCTMHRLCQGMGGPRRSRSTSSRKRDCSPSALSPRYSPVHHEQNSRQIAQEQWQIAVQPEDINNLQKVQDLESDKKTLILQASVLADRVDAQADKIGELERLLDNKKGELIRLEQNLHQEALARSSVENSKLELMTELSNLRLRLTAAERDRKESDEKYRKLECDLVAFQTRVIEHDTEHSLLNGTVSRNGPRNHDVDIEKLKTALDSVIISNDEKDQKIENLKSTLTKYKKLQDVLSSHSKNAENSLRDVKSFDSNQTISSLNNDVKQSSFGIGKSHGYSSSISHVINQSSQSHCSSNLHNSLTASSLHKSNSEENISQSALIATPNSQYGTMPRQTGNQVLQQLQVQLKEHEANTNCNLVSAAKSGERINGENSLKIGIRNTNSRGKSSGVSFGKGFFKLKSGIRSSSEPFLAAEECITIPSTEKDALTFAPPLTPQPYLIKSEKDKKGFLKFLSKFKKTGSQNIDRIEGDFKRGGIRATAGPRLGWSRDLSEDPNIPFPRWNTDLVVEWLHKLGLSMYVGECKRWMCNGEMLINASGNDLEKELVIKNPLHKKKLMLAIKRMNSSVPNLPPSINNLDYHWVVRWLDDVGLPQYKDSFAEARVDGHVLHCLTVDDLLYLKVFSQLHHVSICRGIQVLREKGFDPHCLVRRSLPDEGKTYCPQFVALWSNHRVMEWLRTVDLSEYAPNLRGSGVHGALIVHEPKFNTNLFASLLNIPPTKTLLRRHLATHFKHIIGDELTQIKREKENDAPLSPSVKIKAVRKTQFALKKKRNKNEIENEDYVCPMDIPVINETPKVLEADKLVVRRNSDPSPQEQKHLDLKIILEVDATERIGAVSKENPPLNTIHPDENLNESPTTIV